MLRYKFFLSIQELHEGVNKGYCRNVANHTKLMTKALHYPEKKVQKYIWRQGCIILVKADYLPMLCPNRLIN